MAQAISDKLVRRHPHVFGGEPRSWDAIKAEEQAAALEEFTQSAQRPTRRQGARHACPGRCHGHLEEAAKAGFEREDIDGVWAKVQRNSRSSSSRTQWRPGSCPGGAGRCAFTLVNVARWCQLDPEEGLAGTNHRFLDRFSRVETALGGDLQGRSINELEALWQQAKAQIKAEMNAEINGLQTPAPASETP